MEIDGHIFRVPNEHLVQGSIPWLPSSQSAVLMFVINPGEPLKEQMIVTIESTSKTCNPKLLAASSQLTSVCLAASESAGNNDTQGLELEKIYWDGGSTQWDYRQKGQEMVVASCYALSGTEESGLCTSLWHYGGLVYSVGMRDSDVERFRSIQQTINDLLMSWEAAAAYSA